MRKLLIGVAVTVSLLPFSASAQTSCSNLTRSLSLGSRGSDVVQLQTFLISQGDLAAGNNTGFFGKLTESAVKSFQRRNGIAQNGTPATTGYGAVGPKTRAAIAKACIAAKGVSAPLSSGSQPYYFQGVYAPPPYAQSVYYSQSGYFVPNYSQATYAAPYSQAAYYSQGTYYSQSSYAPGRTYVQNAITVSGTLQPAYQTPSGLVSYRISGSDVIAATQSSELWRKTLSGGTGIYGLSGGADVNADGYPEVFAAQTGLGPSTTCAGTSVDQSQISVLDGKTGALLYAAKLPNCGTSTGQTFRVNQFYAGSVLFGKSNALYVARQYEDQGWALRIANGIAESVGTSLFPVSGGHAANGLIVGPAGAEKLVFFTSGRAVQFALQKTADSILAKLYDAVLASHQSATDEYDDQASPQCFDGCRNYGVAAAANVDGVDKVVLISGTPADSLAQDSRSGTKSNDIHGGIARHMDVYDVSSGQIQLSRYYSYSHDPNNTDAHQYGGRVTYPAHPVLRSNSAVTYVVYNVYNQVSGRTDATPDDRWYVSFNQLGANGGMSEIKVYGYYVWDVISDTNGAAYFVVSKTNGYWPEKKTSVATFAGNTFTPIETKDGLPVTATAFRTPEISTSNGYLMPVLVDSTGIITR